MDGRESHREMSDDGKENLPLVYVAERDKAKRDKRNKRRGKHNPKYYTNTPDQQDAAGPSSLPSEQHLTDDAAPEPPVNGSPDPPPLDNPAPNADATKIFGSKVWIGFWIFLALVVSGAALIHKLDVFHDHCTTELIVIFCFMIPNVIGSICLIYLIRLAYNYPSLLHRTELFTFAKVKLISMYVFGIGFMFHTGLYIWKNTTQEDCPGNGPFDIVFDVLSLVYTCIIFVYFAWYFQRTHVFTVAERNAFVGIIGANSCIWLDAIVFELDFQDDVRTSTACDVRNTTASNKAIERTKTFLSPAMVEFSLLSIDMLFLQSNGNVYCTINGNSETRNNRDDIDFKYHFVGKLFQIIFLVAIVLLFAFTLVVVITTDSPEDHPEFFSVYVCIQLIMKIVMFIMILICLFVEFESFAINRDVSEYVLLAACMGNMLYHVLFIIALGNDKQLISSSTLIASIFDNIFGILLALSQTLLLIGIHSRNPNDNLHNSHSCQKLVYYLCSLVGVLNMGLWVGDSIGEVQLPVFSSSMYRGYGSFMWSLIHTIIFPLTIFYRFQTGFDLLEYYWENTRFKYTDNKTTQTEILLNQ